MAGSVPKEAPKPDVPGGFVETPASENQTFSVNPIPATAGLGNPVKLAPGDKVPDPSTLTSNTVSGTVKTDKGSYENADAGVASQVAGGKDGDMMSVPPVTKGMIPESSLPMGSGPAGDGSVQPFISSVGPQSTTAVLAGAVPLEPKGVPEVVSESQAKAHVSPEASANPEAVAEKKDVEAELKKKVPEEPAAAEASGTAAAGDKSEPANNGPAVAATAEEGSASTPQKENVKPESSESPSAKNGDKKKKRRSVFFNKIKKFVKGE
jgi:hypothetical protein